MKLKKILANLGDTLVLGGGGAQTATEKVQGDGRFRYVGRD